MIGCADCEKNRISSAGASICRRCSEGYVSNGDRTECGKELVTCDSYFQN